MKDKYPGLWNLLVILGSVIKDGESALKPGQNIISRVFDFQDVLPELIAFAPLAGKVVEELKAMNAADYAAAAEQLAAELNFLSPKAEAILAAAIPLVDELASFVPKLEAFVAAVKA